VGEGKTFSGLQLMSDTSICNGAQITRCGPSPNHVNAFIYDYLNELNLPVPIMKMAAEILEKKLLTFPNDPRYHSSLGNPPLQGPWGGKKEAANKRRA